MSLEQSYKKFEEGILFVNSLITNAHQEPVVNDIKNFIVESAFLKMFIYWESYLEETLLKYLSGNTGLVEPLPLRYLSPIDELHANKMIIGTQKYVDWANVEIVKRISKLFIENGEPFNVSLSSIQDSLNDLKVIRNNTAHISSTTNAAFLSIVRRKIPNWAGSSISVSDFLMMNSHEDAQKTILQTYQDSLLIAGEIIKNCDR
ncbi:hypothetical protein COO59_02720 [Mixta theicola]|uniref:RiboL-PSP-HEPN domain-containing protein n=1 Tax=Mixta theicola TaxID=1458355 RepID=A0A2K1QCU4_9GAMM|nr:hypothetical protein [Mixta theicola]PNS12851.1 hypothetical protein COO59_02720 [Mixta theicola]GLR09100.1 hypothetical protein GCM10007905_18200 [Mixta theicola]